MNPESTFTSHIEKKLPEAITFLKDLVSNNSFTLNAEGVNLAAARVIAQFSPLNFSVSQVQCAHPGTGKHLVLDSGGDGPTVAFISHLDTVYSPETELANNFHWRTEGDIAYGPGVTDIHGDTVVMWMVLDALAVSEPELFQQIRWLVILNAAEEKLLPDFEDLCRKVLPENTKACLVFEADSEKTENFCLVESRKGRCHFKLEITGKDAHAGGYFPEGASAIHQLARVIERMMEWVDLDNHTTVNVGVVEGGTVVNTVASHASAEIEVRAFETEHYQKVRDAFLAMSGPGDIHSPNGNHQCHVNVILEHEMTPWPKNDKTDSLVEIWKAAAAEINFSLKSNPRGGLSDGNPLWSDFPTLDGLGPRGGNVHCAENNPLKNKVPEYIDLSSLVPKAILNYVAIRKLISS